MIDPLTMQGRGIAPTPVLMDPGMTLPAEGVSGMPGMPGMPAQDPMGLPADPSADTDEPEPVPEAVEPPAEPEESEEPIDPVSATVDEILYLDPQDAIRRVYQIAVSAAKARAKVDAAGERLDVQQYHAIASAVPEVRYARELTAARRRLDTLAGERRRLALELSRMHDQGRGSGVLAAQLAAADMAMGQVAKGVLLFLSLPSPDLLETQNGE